MRALSLGRTCNLSRNAHGKRKWSYPPRLGSDRDVKTPKQSRHGDAGDGRWRVGGTGHPHPKYCIAANVGVHFCCTCPACVSHSSISSRNCQRNSKRTFMDRRKCRFANGRKMHRHPEDTLCIKVASYVYTSSVFSNKSHACGLCIIYHGPKANKVIA